MIHVHRLKSKLRLWLFFIFSTVSFNDLEHIFVVIGSNMDLDTSKMLAILSFYNSSHFRPREKAKT